jgi:hypothetical protein
VTRRVAVALLAPPAWAPPGKDPREWRLALAEDLLDVFGRMAEAEPALAVVPADAPLRSQVGWPGLRGYQVEALRIRAVLAAVAADGYDQAVLVAPDVPDLPGMLLGKLLRPLGSRPVAVAPVLTDGSGRYAAGVVALASRLPAPDWLPDGTLDELRPETVRGAAPQPGEVAVTPGWHRLRGPDDLGALDERLEGWEATRALLAARLP